jgi:hypothetical protein
MKLFVDFQILKVRSFRASMASAVEWRNFEICTFEKERQKDNDTKQ